VLPAVPSGAVESWLFLLFSGLSAVVNALAMTSVSRHISHALSPQNRPFASVPPTDLPGRARTAARLVVASWPARVYLGLVALVYGYAAASEITGDPSGYAYLALVTLPSGMMPIPGEWSWALIPVAGGLINAAYLTVLTRVHRPGSPTPSPNGSSAP
jgi:hypothetical protein